MDRAAFAVKCAESASCNCNEGLNHASREEIKGIKEWAGVDCENISSLVCNTPNFGFLFKFLKDSKSPRKGDAEMASKLLIPILLGTICMLTLVTASENGNFKHSQVISMPTATAERNTLVLLIQWPFSYCCPKKQESCCLKPYTTTDFIIHTIWTLNSKRQIQMDCNGPLFDEHKLSRPVVEFSRVFWPSLNCSYDDLEYWKTEWERHGRCSDLSQVDWFKLGIKLFEPDFIVGFNAEGIVPGGKYNADQFKKALKLAVGKDVDLRCNTNSATGERQLYEVLICYDPEDKKVIDCGPHNVPGPGTWACPGNVVLPRKPCKPSPERRCDSDA